MVVSGSRPFRCSVITPESLVFDDDVTFAALPAHDGEIGVLHHRAPLLCKLGIGTLRLQALDAGEALLMIDGGFARMLNNELVVLTRRALDPDQIDRDTAERALSDALAMKITDEPSFQARQEAIARARAQRKLASLWGKSLLE